MNLIADATCRTRVLTLRASVGFVCSTIPLRPLNIQGALNLNLRHYQLAPEQAFVYFVLADIFRDVVEGIVLKYEGPGTFSELRQNISGMTVFFDN